MLGLLRRLLFRGWLGTILGVILAAVDEIPQGLPGDQADALDVPGAADYFGWKGAVIN